MEQNSPHNYLRMIALPHVLSTEKGRIDVQRPAGGNVNDLMRSIGWTPEPLCIRQMKKLDKPAPPKAPAATLFQLYFLKSRVDGMRHICIHCRTCRRPARPFIQGILRRERGHATNKTNS